jgi:hypothetical protein
MIREFLEWYQCEADRTHDYAQRPVRLKNTRQEIPDIQRVDD